MQITISGKDKNLLKQVEDLAQRLGLEVSKKQEMKTKKKQKALDALESLKNLNAFKDIDDPVTWQREQRKDRNIGRDE